MCSCTVLCIVLTTGEINISTLLCIGVWLCNQAFVLDRPSAFASSDEILEDQDNSDEPDWKLVWYVLLKLSKIVAALIPKYLFVETNFFL